MTTKNQKSPQKLSDTNSKTLIYICLLLALCSLIASLYAIKLIKNNEQSDALNANALFSKQVRYAFCHDHKIAPCTDDAISIWNQSNPTEAFKQ